MTRPLRTAHRILWFLLPPAALALLAWGVRETQTTTPPNPGLVWRVRK